MPKYCYNYNYIITRLYGHIIMKTFSLLYVYKTYKVIKLYWHVSFYNNYVIVIYIYIYIYIYNYYWGNGVPYDLLILSVLIISMS